MQLRYVCSQFPYGSAESFLGDEIQALRRLGIAVSVSPVRRPGTIRPGWDVLSISKNYSLLRQVLIAIRVMVARPRMTFRLLWDIARDPKHLAKNLAVLPLGLCWGHEIRVEDACDHIHAHWLSTSSTAAWIASRASGVPFSVTAHRWDIVDANLLRVKGREAKFVRSISKRGAEALAQRSRSSVAPIVLHMGVSVAGWESGATARGKSAHDAGLFRVACVANLVEVKGHRFLLDALTQCQARIQLEICGDGPLREELEEQVSALRLHSRVTFRGHVPRETILDEYCSGRYSAAILPSLDLGSGEHEGVPVALMEAMALGVPVVSTTTGAIEELIDHGLNGLLLPPCDPAAITAALDLLNSEPLLCSRLAEQARAKIQSEFSVDRIALTLKCEFESHIR